MDLGSLSLTVADLCHGLQSWETKIVATGVAEFDGAAQPSRGSGAGGRKGKGEKEIKPNVKHPHVPVVDPSKADVGEGSSSGAASDARKAARTDGGRPPRAENEEENEAVKNGKERAGEKRKRAEATDEITSDLDDSDEEEQEVGEIEGEDMVLCLYDKVRGRTCARGSLSLWQLLMP
jgi:hypothetical protein